MIRLEHVLKKFGNRTVLRDVSMEVPTGSVTVILGPSGSGKTTFLRTINFLGQADGGTLQLDEDKPVDMAHASKKEILQVRRNTAMVFQLYNLFSPHDRAGKRHGGAGDRSEKSGRKPGNGLWPA